VADTGLLELTQHVLQQQSSQSRSILITVP
jgi:hypothetical protein